MMDFINALVATVVVTLIAAGILFATIRFISPDAYDTSLTAVGIWVCSILLGLLSFFRSIKKTRAKAANTKEWSSS